MMDLPREEARSIVNVASLASLMHGGDCFTYGVSKVGVAYLTASVAQDVLPQNIRVNAVSPGMFNLSVGWRERLPPRFQISCCG